MDALPFVLLQVGEPPSKENRKVEDQTGVSVVVKREKTSQGEVYEGNPSALLLPLPAFFLPYGV